ncbi:ABC transporter ATP-binding protein [Adhaeretor mobilis]|uniref:Daunorubicin/doxorubicin resistance ATP-binding protein DrrA n=1 Tax=Adhaeretor mobilis TaxID=1930276 RepID=A0A517MZ91_9BACT|nr:ATP-binding cassette domain-containing protein [Adhaeretor mobilis]QDT00174.1 Daunorubicin/doxorubicin resistance ATP-binding protein DrrA [Adhaeretor mobilis]
MGESSAIVVSEVSYRYGEREALKSVSLEVAEGEVFVFLGPNGSGKTTLFRLLSTLIPLQAGSVAILGSDLTTEAAAVRRSIGVVFQAASLDKKLTVAENLKHQGHLYGLMGPVLAERQRETLEAVGMADRRNDLVETLSGGMKRRVELAKGLLHQPRLLLLDEPSTGLDPGARSDLWKYLGKLREEQGITVVLTTHLLDEAERANRLAIMHEGQLAALDTPAALRASLGGDTITLSPSGQKQTVQAMADEISNRFDCPAIIVGETVRLEQANGPAWITKLMDAFPEQIQTITLGKPTLEDVFIARTGHRFFGQNEPDA